MQIVFFVAVFLSAFLLFLIQPMLAKILLPLVGGAPSVWTASMLFFQLLLLGGYGYAAISSRFTSVRTQSFLHIVLMALTVLMLIPLALRPAATDVAKYPEYWIILTLGLTIGAPYFLLAANSSTLQRWYLTTYRREPYHLFSASNAGSFLGLFAYPFAFEWMYAIPQQLLWWGYGFTLLLICFLAFPLLFTRLLRQQPELAAQRQRIGNIPKQKIGQIVFLAFIPSSLFLSVTLYITTDVASVPMLWVVPLALYLLSFVIVFAPWGARWITLAQTLHPLMLVGFAVTYYLSIQHLTMIAVHYLMFFIIAVSCHGRLAHIRPAPENLTAYFFWMSCGGALGGLFNLLAPTLFNDVYEYCIVMVLSIFALPGNIRIHRLWPACKRYKWPLTGMGIVLIAIFQAPFMQSPQKIELLYKERNFFGVSRVERDADIIQYGHGTTLHGKQSTDPTKKLTVAAYYMPVNELLKSFPRRFFEEAFATLGLGVGTVSCLGKSGQQMDFFDIDPLVIQIAGNADYFTYMRDCPPRKNIYLGDGRIEFEKMPDRHYNLIIVDVFSSDAIPMHFLTQQALELYHAKLTGKEGVIAFNLSNRYLNLTPFVARVAQHIGLEAYTRTYFPPAEDARLVSSSIWLLAIPPDSPWKKRIQHHGFSHITADPQVPLWTDDYSNLLPAIRWGQP